MNIKKNLENRIRGWLPKEPSLAVARKTPKPRWRNPYWITFTLVVAVALAGVVYFSVNTYLRYSNPRMDITASYFEKTVNSTSVDVGDVVEVDVVVGWHGYVLPEFERNVKIIDPFPESYLSLASENETNIYQSQSYGGSFQVKYSLRVLSGEGEFVELPKPRLYLDDAEIPLTGTSPTLKIAS
jgi:hypothetical protein